MKLKDLVKSSGGSGSDLWNVPLELLDPNPHNIRLDGPALREHIASLAESIQTHGFLRSRPLTVRQAAGDRLVVVDGNCRLLAVRLAMANGAEIKTLPCLSEAPNTSEADRTLNMLLANSGLQHTPMEYAASIKRLLSWGWTDTDIAKKAGCSRTTLYTFERFMAAREILRNGRDNGPRGRKLPDKGIEAWEEEGDE